MRLKLIKNDQTRIRVMVPVEFAHIAGNSYLVTLDSVTYAYGGTAGVDVLFYEVTSEPFELNKEWVQ